MIRKKIFIFRLCGKRGQKECFEIEEKGKRKREEKRSQKSVIQI
jgi:hypothetical protein